MRKPVPPCCNCCERSLGCHAECDRYKEYEKDAEDYRKRMSHARNKDWGEYRYESEENH